MDAEGLLFCLSAACACEYFFSLCVSLKLFFLKFTSLIHLTDFVCVTHNKHKRKRKIILMIIMIIITKEKRRNKKKEKNISIKTSL